MQQKAQVKHAQDAEAVVESATTLGKRKHAEFQTTSMQLQKQEK